MNTTTWLDRAHVAMRQLMASGDAFSADDLLALAGYPDGAHTANSRNSAIGSLFGQYSSAGEIIPVGVVRSTAASRKGGMIRQWRAVTTESSTLFDLAPYGGPERPPRPRRRTAPSEVKLFPPWVLLSSRRGGPVAHLLTAKAAPNQYGAWPTRCERLGYRVLIEGHPMARCCAPCWHIYQDAEL